MGELEIRKVGVVGSGLSGAGIAQLCVQRGLEVVLFDETDHALSWAEDHVLRGLHRAEQPAAFSLMRKSTDLGRLQDCDFVIDSASEKLELNKDLFRRVDTMLPPACVLAANTAVLPV